MPTPCEDECAQADRDAAAAAGAALDLLARFAPGIDPDRHPRDLSEGQRLSLALAVVLVGRPPLVLLDEPTRGLDYLGKAALVVTLRALADEGHAVVLATHDVELAAALADRTVVLAGGEIVSDGPTREVVMSSPAFAPQVAKILAPLTLLTVDEVGPRAAGGGMTTVARSRRRPTDLARRGDATTYDGDACSGLGGRCPRVRLAAAG